MIRILGIDPGSRVTGYGIIDADRGRNIHIKSGCIKIDGMEIKDKLRLIFQEIQDLFENFQPKEVSIEKIFMHKNADSAIKLGQARGAAITACAQYDIQLFEYTANQIKKATVGKGHAAKQQVQHMVKVLLCLPEIPQHDVADALAAALCHSHSRSGFAHGQSRHTKQTSWS